MSNVENCDQYSTSSSNGACKNAGETTPLLLSHGSISNKAKSAPTEKKDEDGTEESERRIQLFKRRWAMLALCCSFAYINGIQNLQYAALPTSALDYYQVSAQVFDVLTLLYYLAFAVFAIPCVWFVQRTGLRPTVLCCSLLCFTGSVLAIAAAADQKLFALAGIAQAVNGVAQVFIMSLATKLAATWFGPSEVSTATSILVFFYQAGSGLALVIPPILIPESKVMGLVRERMLIFFGIIGSVTFVIVILVLIFFENNPPLPPSGSQFESSTREPISYKECLKSMLKNRHFSVLVISFGLNYGAFNALETLITPQISKNFSELTDKTIGQIAATMVLVGTPGPLVFGIWLDKRKSYLETSSFAYLMCTFGCALYTAAVESNWTWSLWVTLGGLGFFLSAYMSVGMEIAAELTYPAPESTASGLIYSSGAVSYTSQYYGICLPENILYRQTKR
ncbi:unnamed protein product [Clavelina lepadiformis]|uniref:Uncharacterized protein n=1 Tax=Clavelina lepadiformis TaxID=159417 RepID=A0ABP0GZR7_CLALP